MVGLQRNEVGARCQGVAADDGNGFGIRAGAQMRDHVGDALGFGGRATGRVEHDGNFGYSRVIEGALQGANRGHGAHRALGADGAANLNDGDVGLMVLPEAPLQVGLLQRLKPKTQHARHHQHHNDGAPDALPAALSALLIAHVQDIGLGERHQRGSAVGLGLEQQVVDGRLTQGVAVLTDALALGGKALSQPGVQAPGFC